MKWNGTAYYVICVKLTCDQCRRCPGGKRLKRFTSKTHALQISPCRCSRSWKHALKSISYFLESVKRELLDLALQMQQPCDDRYTFGLWNENIVHFILFFLLLFKYQLVYTMKNVFFGVVMSFCLFFFFCKFTFIIVVATNLTKR